MINNQLQRKWDFVPAVKPYISDDCKDFLNHLLEPNPLKRFTMEQVCAHKWMPTSKK